MKSRLMIYTVIGLLMNLLFSAVSAQTFLFQDFPLSGPQLGMRYLRPFYEGGEELSFISGVYDFSFNVPISSKVNWVGSIPFSHFAFKYGFDESDVQNIYCGLQIRHRYMRGQNSSFSLGVFLPTASNDKYMASSAALFANVYQLPKYRPNMWTLYGNFTYRSFKREGPIWGFEAGPDYLIPKKNSGEKSELYMHYGLTAGFRATQLAVLAEFASTGLVSGNAGHFGERFNHAVTLGAQWIGSGVRPGVFYKLYLDKDLSDFIDGVLGIKLDVILKYER